MQYHWIDGLIILFYIAGTVLIGFWVRKRASKNLDSYFLGNKTMPWYVLGVSQAAGMFDIAGTMWLVSLFFVIGMRSIFIPFAYPWFIHVFYMVYMAAWVRRSNVLTGGEWTRTRFGEGRGSRLSQLSVVIFALVLTVAMLAYACVGIGKFADVFLPDAIGGITMTPKIYGVGVMLITALYVIIGGFHSVALTSVLQFSVMIIGTIIVAVIALVQISPEMIDSVVPNGWKDIMLSWKMHVDWATSGKFSILGENKLIVKWGYDLLILYFMLAMLKGWLTSMAGPCPNYDMQRILATKNTREASLTFWFVSVVVLIPRYLLVGAIAVLGLVYMKQLPLTGGGGADTEKVLPFVMSRFLPVGVFGLLMADLLAAFMSTFAATLNAGAVYFVNDVYKKYIRPGAEEKTYVRASYVTTFVILIVGLAFGLLIPSVDSITKVVFLVLWGSYGAANILKWHWWRLNGYGYFWGMVSGIGLAVIYAIAKYSVGIPDKFDMYAILVLAPITIIASVIGSLLTAPQDFETLKTFYRRVRPWGFWKPVYQKVIAEEPDFKRNTNFKRDMVNICVGIVWQTSLTIFPLFLIIKEWGAFAVTISVTLVTSIFLKYNWYDKLEKD